jgi:uncharacterized protein YjbJ (UPF0337 family)
MRSTHHGIHAPAGPCGRIVAPAWAAYPPGISRVADTGAPGRPATAGREVPFSGAGARGIASRRNANRREGGFDMGDKLQGKVDQATGKMKEAAGKAGNDESLENEGRRDQSKGDLREAAGKVKDAVDR